MSTSEWMSLLVGNLDIGTSEQELCLHFGNRCGQSPKVKIQRDPKNGRSLGYAILEFSQKDAYDKAVAMDKSQFRGRPLKVRASKLVADLYNDDVKKIDPLKEFLMQLDRRFVARSIAPLIKRCPGCFLPLIAEDFSQSGTVYYCPKCHVMTKLFRDYDERLILAQCRICFDLCQIDQMIPCRAEHLFCTRCINRWLRHCINNGTGGKIYLPCPICEAVFLRSEIADHVNDEQLAIFEMSLARTNQRHRETLALGELKNDDSTLFRRCPQCRYSWIADEETIKPRLTGASRCPQPGCWHSFCSKCLSPWGNDLKEMNCKMCKLVASAKEQLYWEDRKANIIRRFCPKCSLPLFRHDGSNYVTCDRCNTHICFICREVNVDMIDHYCRCFRDPKKPDEHWCDKRCLIFQDSDLYDAEQLQLLEKERARPDTVVSLDGTAIGAPADVQLSIAQEEAIKAAAAKNKNNKSKAIVLVK